MSNEDIQNPAFLILINHNVVTGVNMKYVREKVKVKVKQPRYRPGVAQRVPGI
jgi:hypothetical protein